MDDLFQILIYLIIIISFLSSIFKKKAPPPQQQRKQPQDRIPETPEPEHVQEYQQKVDETDILKEIENMFKTEAEKQQQSTVQLPDIEKVREPRRKVRDYSEQTVSASEHQPEFVVSESIRRKPVIDSKIEAEAKSLEAYLESRSAKHEEATRSFIRKLKNPKTIREFILVSEILSKPKALRR